MNPMQQVVVDKVVVHMGVGEAGDKLVKAEDILKTITGQSTVRTIARNTVPAFGIRKGAPIGCKVTLRGNNAIKFLETSLKLVDVEIVRRQFDQQGNFGFGIDEHTDFPGMSYDPKIGIFGMDVNVALKKPGARIARRTIAQRKVPHCQVVKPDEAVSFITQRFGVEVK
jgi:large subunit ribosomal protein L5